MIKIRKAKPDDLDAIKSLVDSHKHELGFVLRPALMQSIDRDEIFVANGGETVVGILEYHHRLDQQTTIYHLVVVPELRRQGVGRRLIEALKEEAKEYGKSYILLKCPEDLEANNFYKRIGFQLTTIEDGHQRNLNVWKIPLKL